MIDELEAESVFLVRVQDNVTRLMNAYREVQSTTMLPEEIRTNMFACRGHLLSNAGKLIKMVGQELLGEKRKRAVRSLA